MAAARHERHDDVVALGEVRHAGADLLDDLAAASCPSTIGSGRGRLPSITERSEWQRPAARILTSTSPGPGGVELDLLDRERLRLCVGWRAADLAKYGGVDFHAREHIAALARVAGGPGETRRKYVRVGSHAASMPRDGFSGTSGDPSQSLRCARAMFRRPDRSLRLRRTAGASAIRAARARHNGSRGESRAVPSEPKLDAPASSCIRRAEPFAETVTRHDAACEPTRTYLRRVSTAPSVRRLHGLMSPAASARSGKWKR